MDFIVEKKVIKLDKSTLDGKVVSYNSDYVANFIFDDEWEGKVKTVRFINNGEYVDVVLTDTDSCKIPLEVMKSGQLEVGVFAGNLQTTTAAKVAITASILEETGVPADPTDDVYTQIMEKLDEMEVGSGGSVDSYNDLDDLPSINDVTIVGDMYSSDLGLQDELIEFSTTEIIEMWNKTMNS